MRIVFYWENTSSILKGTSLHVSYYPGAQSGDALHARHTW
jgi:hypothetical protein